MTILFVQSLISALTALGTWEPDSDLSADTALSGTGSSAMRTGFCGVDEGSSIGDHCVACLQQELHDERIIVLMCLRT